jgi:phage shock protein A
MEKEISALESRINRLEAQMQFVGDRVQQNQASRRP